MSSVRLVEEDVLAIVNEILIVCMTAIRILRTAVQIVVAIIGTVGLSGMCCVIIPRQSIRLDAVFYAQLLPEFATYLVAALAYLEGDYFARHCCLIRSSIHRKHGLSLT